MTSTTISVGPIQHYVPGSTWFDLTKYDNLATQERVAVNLSSSNLWLVDSSKLFLSSDYAPRIAFLNEGAGYRSPIQISATGNTLGEATVFSDLSGIDSVLSSANAPLRRGDWVQLSELSAGTQINFSVIPNGVVNPGATPLSTDSQTNPVSPYNPSSPVFWLAYADPKANVPVFILGYEDIAGAGSDNDFNDGLLVLDLGLENFNQIFSSANLGQDSTISLKNAQPVPVPFEMHSSIGLILIAALLGHKLWSRWISAQRTTQR
ncbi:DUF4114 domain-containing protein [Leptolyngbya boryana CZ1]|uniref:DUF4114 domain-containing protein n=1 Tax=Leptolyngbya boryana CZ1 TaxID=3060204 RepID=A0AA97AKL2_LEPBY|nr:MULTISPECIES: DUF4114 domain-containing protein [Leptolyngbya]MBD1855440.1 DUF4114 domain-containing protein [Leptolyngbya sp. FACHB-1624]MBN8565000.1 DUF4114 domain-containing protein [Leptolyngbya sp. UWPOB_LEPTO1]WNZ43373.1 DUF4114 domain-containing protein [Leptolyngbya boryana CZ1]